MLPFIFPDISLFHFFKIRSFHSTVFCVAVKMLHQFIITVPHIYADHLVHCLPYFPLSTISPNIKIFHRIRPVHFMSKTFQSADYGQSFQIVLRHNLVSY